MMEDDDALLLIHATEEHRKAMARIASLEAEVERLKEVESKRGLLVERMDQQMVESCCRFKEEIERLRTAIRVGQGNPNCEHCSGGDGFWCAICVGRMLDRNRQLQSEVERMQGLLRRCIRVVGGDHAAIHADVAAALSEKTE